MLLGSRCLWCFFGFHRYHSHCFERFNKLGNGSYKLAMLAGKKLATVYVYEYDII